LIFVVLATTSTHCQFCNFEKLIQFQSLEKEREERIYGVETTFHHGYNVITPHRQPHHPPHHQPQPPHKLCP
jgi:hypothetical protein